MPRSGEKPYPTSRGMTHTAGKDRRDAGRDGQAVIARAFPVAAKVFSARLGCSESLTP
jgi:hypothetical protein